MNIEKRCTDSATITQKKDIFHVYKITKHFQFGKHGEMKGGLVKKMCMQIDARRLFGMCTDVLR